jgi:valyl-tRNA synthetase
MIMMGVEFMGEVPFRQVYIHGLVRDAERQKMSKTRGNTIDPLVVTEKYGTDAVRMALLQGAAPGTDIVLSEKRMESSRNFANKIWNAARFLLGRMETAKVEPWLPDSLETFLPQPCADTLEVPVEDRWIFSRLNNAAEQANRAIEQYRYHELAQIVWHFFWHEFCDWYIELKKLRFRDNTGLTSDWRNALAAFETALRLLHPAMPFLTEELWQRLAAGHANRPESIALAFYPQYRADVADHAAEREIGILQEVVTMARTLRADSKLDPKQQLAGTLYSRNDALELARRHAGAIERLSNVKLEFASGTAPYGRGAEGASVATRSTAEFDLVLRLPKSQEEAQRKRLEKEREQLQKNIANINRQLGDQTFKAKAPPHVVDGLVQKLGQYQEQLRKIDGTL